MKKKMFLALCALIAGIFTSCKDKEIVIVDHNGYGYYHWVNESEHSITLSLEATHVPDFEETLAPGDSYSITHLGMGDAIPPGSGDDWRMTVFFDDETHNVIFERDDDVLLPVGYDQKFNPILVQNYRKEIVESPEGCEECLGARWTYTFTDADYDAAIAFAQREQAPLAE